MPMLAGVANDEDELPVSMVCVAQQLQRFHSPHGIEGKRLSAHSGAEQREQTLTARRWVPNASAES